jgi:hypothetical protein
VNTIKSLVAHYQSQPRVKFGPAPPRPKKINRATFQADLDRVRRANERYFLIGTVLIGVLFVALLAVIVLSLDHPDRMQWVGAGFGGTQLAVLGLYRRWWGERNQADMLRAALPYLSDEALQEFVDDLWRRQTRRAPPSPPPPAPAAAGDQHG